MWGRQAIAWMIRIIFYFFVIFQKNERQRACGVTAVAVVLSRCHLHISWCFACTYSYVFKLFLSCFMKIKGTSGQEGYTKITAEYTDQVIDKNFALEDRTVGFGLQADTFVLFQQEGALKPEHVNSLKLSPEEALRLTILSVVGDQAMETATAFFTKDRGDTASWITLKRMALNDKDHLLHSCFATVDFLNKKPSWVLDDKAHVLDLYFATVDFLNEKPSWVAEVDFLRIQGAHQAMQLALEQHCGPRVDSGFIARIMGSAKETIRQLMGPGFSGGFWVYVEKGGAEWGRLKAAYANEKNPLVLYGLIRAFVVKAADSNMRRSVLHPTMLELNVEMTRALGASAGGASAALPYASRLAKRSPARAALEPVLGGSAAEVASPERPEGRAAGI
jgi:hypothetical protein